MKTKTKLVFVLVMIATLIISLAVYKIQKDDFKDNFSNVELKQSKEFENDLNGILKSYLQSNDYVDKKDIPKCLSEVYDFCRSHTDVIKLYEYDSKNESVYIELKSGMTYLIIPPVEDRLSGKGSGEIVTFEPNGVLQYPKDGTRVTVTGEAWEGHTAYHQNMMITAILIREY